MFAEFLSAHPLAEPLLTILGIWLLVGLINPQLALPLLKAPWRSRVMLVRLAVCMASVLWALFLILLPLRPWYVWLVFAALCAGIVLCCRISAKVQPVRLDSNWIVYPEGRVSESYEFTAKSQYVHDTRDMSCTCPEWMRTRAGYPQGDPRLLCRHLLRDVCVQNMLHHFRADPEYLLRLHEHNQGYPL